MRGKRFLMGALSGVAVAAMSLGVSVPAMASDSGGASGQGGSSGHGYYTGMPHWKTIVSNKPGEAWQKFLSSSIVGEKLSEHRLLTARYMGKPRFPAFHGQQYKINQCRRSKVIWYADNYAPPRIFGWQALFTGNTASQFGSLTNPPRGSLLGRYPTKAEADNMMKILRDTKQDWNFYHNSKNPIVVMCMWQDVKPADRPHNFIKYGDTKGEYGYDKLYPHTYMSTVTPQPIEGGAPGDSKYKWQPQDADRKRTNVGALCDEMSKNKTQWDANTVRRKIEEAYAKDNKTDYRTSVELSDNNKKVFANGGIINVQEFTSYCRVRATTSWTAKTAQKCSVRQTFKNGRWVNIPGTERCDKPSEVGGTRKFKNVNDSSLVSPKDTGFYQLISVHCNKEGFDALISQARGASVVSRGSSGGKFSAVGKTRVYDAKPSVVDFGQPGTPSSKIGFYDKECAFNCTSAPVKGASTDARNNKGTLGVHSNTSTGVSYNGVQVDGEKNGSGNNLTFFRDNAEHKVRLDVWHPVSDDTVRYNGDSAITTTVTRWIEGTPDVTADKGGKFSMFTLDNTELFKGGVKSELPTQKNWDTTPFNSATMEVLSGEHNTFKMKGSWASETGKPNILNVKWEFDPVTNSRFYNSLGFTSRNGKATQTVGDMGTTGVGIQGKCYAQFGTNTHADRTDVFNKYTGSGTVNKMDAGLIDGAGTEIARSNVNSNLVVSFVRATAE